MQIFQNIFCLTWSHLAIASNDCHLCFYHTTLLPGGDFGHSFASTLSNSSKTVCRALMNVRRYDSLEFPPYSSLPNTTTYLHKTFERVRCRFRLLFGSPTNDVELLVRMCAPHEPRPYDHHSSTMAMNYLQVWDSPQRRKATRNVPISVFTSCSHTTCNYS